MDELVTWLRGVLDETEALAVAASRSDSTTWHVRGHPSETTMVGAEDGSTVVYDEGSPSDEQGAHIARHDPRATLARVEAERAVLRLRDSGLFNARTFTDRVVSEQWEAATHGIELSIRHIAHGHRHDGPGYRDEWAPVA